VLYPRYFGYYDRAVTVYTHTSDEFSVFGSRAISCSAREALYVLDGLLENDTMSQFRSAPCRFLARPGSSARRCVGPTRAKIRRDGWCQGNRKQIGHQRFHMTPAVPQWQWSEPLDKSGRQLQLLVTA
jgi:Tn3 transposase DDE domain